MSRPIICLDTKYFYYRLTFSPNCYAVLVFRLSSTSKQPSSLPKVMLREHSCWQMRLKKQAKDSLSSGRLKPQKKSQTDCLIQEMLPIYLMDRTCC